MLFLFIFLQQFISWPEQPDIQLEVFQNSGDIRVFAPHEDEPVMNDYVRDYVRKHKDVSFFVLHQRGKRTVRLKVGSKHYRVDPNRIYTLQGCYFSILHFHPDLGREETLEAARKAYRLGQFILGQLTENNVRAIITVHNNSNGYRNDGKAGWGVVSILRYLEQQEICHTYAAVNLGSGDEDNLFYVTKQADFDLLTELGYHVVMEHLETQHDPSTDDGSLSYLSEQEGITYFNIEIQETAHGESHLDAGIDMFQTLCRLLNLPEN